MENQNVARKAQLNANYTHILQEVPQSKLLAVTKYSPFEDIEILHMLGHKHFGESRVQDLKLKALRAQEHDWDDVHWHFIGHLQTNKIKDLVRTPNLYAIHSVDSKKILDELYKREALFKSKIRFFIQVNTSGEKEKAGVVTCDEVRELYTYFDYLHFTKLEFAGLMTIGKIRTDNFAADAKRSFAELVKIKQDIFVDIPCELSMGMSADFHWALEYGADWVRLGSALFKNDT